MRTLYFIRHGLAVNNELGILSGQIETPLTDTGRLQAKKAGERLKGKSIDTIVSSPLSRAKETAEIIAEVINFPPNQILINELFIERHYGPIDGQPYVTPRNYDAIEGVESSKDLIERARRGLEWLKTLEGEHILVVSHGAIGRALRHNVPNQHSFHHPTRIKNAQIIKLL